MILLRKKPISINFALTDDFLNAYTFASSLNKVLIKKSSFKFKTNSIL
jgi:hypothetical protein